MLTLEITEIEFPFPEVGNPQLRIVMGAGRLRLAPEAQDVWVRGAYRDPSGWLPCQLGQQGPAVEIVQHLHGGHPALFHEYHSGPPELALTLGQGPPYQLSLELGAIDTHADLGALPLSRLTLKQGAGSIHLDFSAPNPQVMNALTVGAGAGSIELRNLANANCGAITVEGGAAAHKLDFGGTLRRNATVKVTGGMCAIDLILPVGVAARVTTESLLGNVAAGAAFTRRDGAFWTPAALAGGTPLLTITVGVALGAIRLLTS